MQLECSYDTMEVLVCLAVPLSLKVHTILQCLSLYYHKDPPYDRHQPVDPILEKRLADQQEKPACQSTYISIILILV